ncbi:Hypothetical Protein FCC1311_095002 [Hondaea fermentalgiana]|uniref:Uncharacterized protein n=1 Tax=Hondaea fermentalgiana TaxID=2315210 RepID=A0A2R5GQW5_9STRA|nr:Hypothetical Protein FCC1311_095002 [Hondaea fermentalgiana]|eukprot:GBG33276.1 Hypothetical Protein FCC1311_095002 [Hondaea fermentalgiana]
MSGSARRSGGSGDNNMSLVVASKRQELMTAMTEFQKSQRELALASTRAGAYSVMLGLSNRAENARLARRQEELDQRLSLGERALVCLKTQVDDQGMVLAETGAQVQEQEHSIGMLERRVEGQRRHLEQLAQEYKRELAEQRQILESHRAEFGRLMLSKLKQDATLDAVIVLLSWVASKSPVVNGPVALLSMLTGSLPLVPGRPRHRKVVMASAARVAVIVFLARALRIVAARHGLHNSIGGPEVYLRQAARAVGERFPMLATTLDGSSNNACESPASRDRESESESESEGDQDKKDLTSLAESNPENEVPQASAALVSL